MKAATAAMRPAAARAKIISQSATRQTTEWEGMNGLSCLASWGAFAIGELSRVGEDDMQQNRERPLDVKRMTTEEALAARVNELERRLEGLEAWTDADEDWSSRSASPSIGERILAQDLILQHMLRMLEETVPGFSIRTIRERMLLLHDFDRENRAAQTDATPELFDELDERWRKIMTDLLPPSIYDEPEPQRFRPILAHSKSDVAQPPGAGPENTLHGDD
jgi:hypothetical protein